MTAMKVEVFRTIGGGHTLVVNGFRICGPQTGLANRAMASWDVERSVFAERVVRALKVASADGSFT